jgi:hypothetical protein
LIASRFADFRADFLLTFAAAVVGVGLTGRSIRRYVQA